MDWSTWVQGVAGGVIDKAATAKWVQPYDVEKLRMQQLGQTGYYPEGQRQQAAVQPQAGTIGGMKPITLAVIGAGVLVAVLMLRR